MEIKLHKFFLARQEIGFFEAKEKEIWKKDDHYTRGVGQLKISGLVSLFGTAYN